jgi:hypothetical protein
VLEDVIRQIVKRDAFLGLDKRKSGRKKPRCVVL